MRSWLGIRLWMKLRRRKESWLCSKLILKRLTIFLVLIAIKGFNSYSLRRSLSCSFSVCRWYIDNWEEKKLVNISTLKATMLLFELLSKLKIKFYKSPYVELQNGGIGFQLSGIVNGDSLVNNFIQCHCYCIKLFGKISWFHQIYHHLL